jgi:hypothetical protein
MNKAFIDYYRCPESYANLKLAGELSNDDAGYFCFGENTICYGQATSGFRAKTVESILYDVFKDVKIEGATCFLPFDLTQIVDNLRYERYFTHSDLVQKNQKKMSTKILRNAYYFLRPLMPVSLRKHLQRINLRGWDKLPFPTWPVDRTIDQVLEKIFLLSLKSHQVEKIPFIWFWPDGYQGCAMMTHDVETTSGRDFCSRLMDINESFGIRSSFQIVPEQRYEVSGDFLNSIRDRGFEINVHGLCHDGHLFSDRDLFVQRAQRINYYAKEYRAIGFRSPVLYRNPDWFDAFEFSYDMSVPNVAHLDPQRGGCCTVMPYFIGNILELPLTTTQDYSLFHIIHDYSINLWKRQVDLIMEKHGLISFLVHPDYIIPQSYRYVYQSLLEYLSQICEDRNIWKALPREVNSWWRQRSQMTLVNQDGRWRIEGPGKERARVAYARLVRQEIAYEIEETPSNY